MNACGYAFVTSDTGGPVAVLELGVMKDLSPEGDLGVRLARTLRRGLAGRSRPQLAAAGDGAPRLTGTLWPLPERTVGFDAAGALFEVGLRGRIELWPGDSATAWPLWSSGDVERRAVYARGGTALATEANRRAALEALTGRLGEDLLARLLETPGPLP